jgi:hypothetical protein
MKHSGALLSGVTVTVLAVAAALAIFAVGWFAGRSGIGSVIDPASLSDAERQFVERMKGVTLVGSYTIAGGDDRASRPDRYGISSVEKVGTDLWRFNAEMHCCGVDGSIPVVVPLRFVGDTPMIMMTDTTVPGMGTFTVRLLFYGDWYSGTWQHGERGGQMSGRIENQKETDQ